MMLEQLIMDRSSDLQKILFFGLYATVLLIESLMPFRKVSLKRTERWPANFLMTFANLVVLGSVQIGLLAVAAWAETNQVGLLNWVALSPIPLIVSGLLARCLISFLVHLLMHRVSWFWRLHRVHHLDTALDITSALRFHPLEFVVAAIPEMLLILAFGIPPWVLLCYELLNATLSPFSHSAIRLPTRLNAVLQFIIVTPNSHRIHHSKWQPETNSNFGAIFPIWDIVFGTFRAEKQVSLERMEIGLDLRDYRVNQLFWLLRSPFHDRPLEQHRMEARRRAGL